MDSVKYIPPNTRNFYSSDRFEVTNPFTGKLELRHAENNSFNREKGGEFYSKPVIFIEDPHSTKVARLVPCYDSQNTEKMVFIRLFEFIHHSGFYQGKEKDSVVYDGRIYRRLYDEHLCFQPGLVGPYCNFSPFEQYTLKAPKQKKLIVRAALREGWKKSQQENRGIDFEEFRQIYETVKKQHLISISDEPPSHKYGYSFAPEHITEAQYKLLMEDTKKAEEQYVEVEAGLDEKRPEERKDIDDDERVLITEAQYSLLTVDIEEQQYREEETELDDAKRPEEVGDVDPSGGKSISEGPRQESGGSDGKRPEQRREDDGDPHSGSEYSSFSLTFIPESDMPPVNMPPFLGSSADLSISLVRPKQKKSTRCWAFLSCCFPTKDKAIND